MIPSIAFIIAGVCMMVARFHSNSSFLNFQTAWAAYDVAAIVITTVGVVSLAVRLFLIFGLRKNGKNTNKV